ncbi:energy-coupling factor transporter transmembrane protein EcfT [Fructobacillus sp. M2-14]|uniref:Energy-coupling factor transporter transmembrane protein EcfT n=1 Tax=Fructobacillus broussonetiae TaxID=2713173 RepID=A0ABS5R1R3_9LACO|nr:energy-coupling factor transporter transmembrane component T [Fructobacillus broussonetiae]MBS9338112.1 energy-coupling factor transporter transmembrane protein EcfT [Fructobacillus broussonetiae]
MNASQRLFLALLISIEIAVTKSVTLNLTLFGMFFILLLCQRIKFKRLGFYIAVSILPTLGTFWSFYLFGIGGAFERMHTGMIMGSRIMLFVFVSAWLTNSVTPSVLLHSLQQNLKLSPTFIYGLLAALNFVPRFKDAFKSIQASANMRGQSLSWYQPTIYFKALIQAINWSETVAMAMTAHGFQEGASRSSFKRYPYKKSGFAVIAAALFATVVLLNFSQY